MSAPRVSGALAIFLYGTFSGAGAVLVYVLGFGGLHWLLVCR
jgi:hypothetical protein